MVRGMTETGNATKTLEHAYAYLDALHDAPCAPPVKVLFTRMPMFGVSNDLNSLLVVLAKAVRERRQLIILPPTAKERERIRNLAGALTVQRPWHWLEDGMPLDSVVHLSRCQRHLQEQMPSVLDMLGNATNAEPLAARIPEIARLDPYDWYARRPRAAGFHVTLAFVPPQLRRMDDSPNPTVRRHLKATPLWHNGILWWFEVLATYLIRVRGSLAERLQAHPALNALESDALVAARGGDLGGWGAPVGTVPYKAMGGWYPRPTFDVGLQMRMGDACGSKNGTANKKLRRCVTTLSQALNILEAQGVASGRLFLATDSQAIVEEAKAPGGARGFQISYLNIERAKYEPVMVRRGRGVTTKNIEDVLPRNEHGRSSVLEEALLDVLLLSRASLVAGSMASNMPRLALNMRVRPPNRTHYVALDGYEWCAETSCKPVLWNIAKPRSDTEAAQGGRAARGS